MSVTHSTSRRLTLTFSATLLLQILGVVSGALVARLLGADGRGTLAAVTLWPTVLAYMGDLGGPLGLTYLAASSDHDPDRLVRTAVGTALCQSAAITMIGVPITLWGLGSYPDERALGLMYLAAFVPINLLTRYLNGYIQGTGAFHHFNAVRLTVAASYTLGVVVLFMTSSADVVAVVGCIVASNALTLAVAARAVGWARLRPGLDAAIVRHIFGYGLRGHFGNVSFIEAMQLDLVAVVLLLGAYDAGLYAVAAAGAYVVRAQIGALGMVTLPTVAAGPDRAQRIVLAERLFRLGLLLTIVMVAAVVVTAPLVVPLLYGREFAEAVPLTQILCVGVVAASLRKLLGDALRGLGHPGPGTLAEFASWIAAALGLVLFVPTFQVYGAAVAVTVAHTVGFLVGVGFAARVGLAPSRLFRLRQSDFGDLSTAVTVALGRLRRRPSHD